MTRLNPTSPLRRETDVKERGEPLVIEMFPRYLRIRVKGAKTGYNLDYAAAHDLARKIAARNGGSR
jgi:hypothetical protein